MHRAVPPFQYEFGVIRHWIAVVQTVPFTAIFIGSLLGTIIGIRISLKTVKKQTLTNDNKAVPETRLIPMVIGSVFFPAGLFIMAWKAKATIHWIGFCIGAGCLGLGFYFLFQSALAYLVDTYLFLSASTLAANMFTRSILAGASVLFAKSCKQTPKFFS